MEGLDVMFVNVAEASVEDTSTTPTQSTTRRKCADQLFRRAAVEVEVDWAGSTHK